MSSHTTTPPRIDIHKVAALVQQLAQARQELRAQQRTAETQAAEAAQLRAALAELQAAKEEESSNAALLATKVDALPAASSSSAESTPRATRNDEQPRRATHRLQPRVVNGCDAALVKTPARHTSKDNNTANDRTRKEDGHDDDHHHYHRSSSSSRHRSREHTQPRHRRAEKEDHTHARKHPYNTLTSCHRVSDEERWRQRYSDLLRRYRREKARRTEDLTSIHALVEQICLEQDYARLLHEHAQLKQQRHLPHNRPQPHGVERGRVLAPALLHSAHDELPYEHVVQQDRQVEERCTTGSRAEQATGQQTQPHTSSCENSARQAQAMCNTSPQVQQLAQPSSSSSPAFVYLSEPQDTSSQADLRALPQQTLVQATATYRATAEKSVQTTTATHEAYSPQPRVQCVRGTSSACCLQPRDPSSTRQSIETQTAAHILTGANAMPTPLVQATSPSSAWYAPGMMPGNAMRMAAADGSLPLFFTSSPSASSSSTPATNNNNNNYYYHALYAGQAHPSHFTSAAALAVDATQLPPALPSAPYAYNFTSLPINNNTMQASEMMMMMPSLSTLQWFKKYMAQEGAEEGDEASARAARKAQLARDRARHDELLAAIRQLQSTTATCREEAKEEEE